MANRGGDRRRQPTPHMGSVTQRPAHDFSRAVRADGRGVNDAHGETHRTRFLLSCAVLVNTLRPPCVATLTQVNRAPWHSRCGWKDAANGRSWPASDLQVRARGVVVGGRSSTLNCRSRANMQTPTSRFAPRSNRQSARKTPLSSIVDLLPRARDSYIRSQMRSSRIRWTAHSSHRKHVRVRSYEPARE
jgi:hypothetical protein